MKKTLCSITLIAAAILSTATVQAEPHSFQLGTVTGLTVRPGGASFQLDTSVYNIDIRSDCNDADKPLNFTIDTTTTAGAKMYDLVLEAKESGFTLWVNGDGICIGTDTEKADTLVRVDQIQM